jgi:riboflavin kinase/FMN adenylyltransferase
LLEQFGGTHNISTSFLDPVMLRGQVVSSSLIRQKVCENNVAWAGRLLGRCFFIEGPVISGQGVGSKQTVPTLNLRPAPEQVIPHGVYTTETIDGASNRRWPSITNVGIRPTFDGQELTIETFLLEGLGHTPEFIQVQFRQFIRTERRFPDPDALKLQIFRDVARAKRFWRLARKLKTSPVPIY